MVPFAFLGVPGFAVYGYVVRAMAHGTTGRLTRPDLREWPSIIVDGVEAAAVTVVYALPVALIGGWLLVGPGGAVGPTAAAAVVAVVAGVAYVLPAALANATADGASRLCVRFRVRPAFDGHRIARTLASRQYLFGWAKAAAVAVAAVGLTVLATSAVSPVVVFPVLPFVGFYTAICVAYRLGHAWGRADGHTGRDGARLSVDSARSG
jgi:hypothetical protein